MGKAFRGKRSLRASRHAAMRVRESRRRKRYNAFFGELRKLPFKLAKAMQRAAFAVGAAATAVVSAIGALVEAVSETKEVSS